MFFIWIHILFLVASRGRSSTPDDKAHEQETDQLDEKNDKSAFTDARVHVVHQYGGISHRHIGKEHTDGAVVLVLDRNRIGTHQHIDAPLTKIGFCPLALSTHRSMIPVTFGIVQIRYTSLDVGSPSALTLFDDTGLVIVSIGHEEPVSAFLFKIVGKKSYSDTDDVRIHSDEARGYGIAGFWVYERQLNAMFSILQCRLHLVFHQCHTLAFSHVAPCLVQHFVPDPRPCHEILRSPYHLNDDSGCDNKR